MKNSIILPILILLLLPTAASFLNALRPKKRNRLTVEYVLLAASLIGWQIAAISYFSATSVEAAYAYYALDIPFVAFSSMGMFLFVLKYYGIQVRNYPGIIALLCVLPCITTVLALTNGTQNYLYSSLEIVATQPVHIALAQRGIWFWMHAAYCYSLIICACIVMVVQYRKLPPVYRRAATPLVLAMITSLIGNYFVLRGSPAHPLDLSLIGGTGCVLILFAATKENQGLDFLMYARKEIYQNIDKAILILNEDDIVVSANAYAQEMMKSMGIEDAAGMHQMTMQETFARGGVVKKDVSEDEKEWDYVYETAQGTQRVCAVQVRSIKDKRGKTIGTFVLADDVTENRAHIRKLEEISGMDALTGAYNRRTMNEKIAEVEADPAAWPVAVLSGDMNGLKFVNDTSGHQQGDVLLRTAAAAIASICPPNDYFGRIGGDEFLIVAPQCTAEQAETLMAEIQMKLEKFSTPEAPLQMAWGYAVKTDAEETMQDCMRLADKRMYEDKAAWYKANNFRREEATRRAR